MWPVIAAAMNLAQQLNLIEHIVAVGVAHAIDAGAGFINPFLTDHDVEAVKRPQQPVRVTDGQRNRLHLHQLQVATDRRRSDPHHAASSVGSDQPPSAVDTHRDPRAFRFIERMQQFDLETFGHFDRLRLGHRRPQLGKHIAPRGFRI